MRKALTIAVLLFFSAAALCQSLVTHPDKPKATLPVINEHFILPQTRTTYQAKQRTTFSKAHKPEPVFESEGNEYTTLGSMWRGGLLFGVLGGGISFSAHPHNDLNHYNYQKVFVGALIGTAAGVTAGFITGIVSAAKRRRQTG